MQALTTIKTTCVDTLNIYNNKDELIATACKPKKSDNDFHNGEYRICIFGGIAHGKVAYAKDFQDLNDKSVEISKLPRH